MQEYLLADNLKDSGVTLQFPQKLQTDSVLCLMTVVLYFDLVRTRTVGGANPKFLEHLMVEKCRPISVQVGLPSGKWWHRQMPYFTCNC